MGSTTQCLKSLAPEVHLVVKGESVRRGHAALRERDGRPSALEDDHLPILRVEEDGGTGPLEADLEAEAHDRLVVHARYEGARVDEGTKGG